MPGAISFLFPPFSFNTRETPPRHFLPEGLWFWQEDTWSSFTASALLPEPPSWVHIHASAPPPTPAQLPTSRAGLAQPALSKENEMPWLSMGTSGLLQLPMEQAFSLTLSLAPKRFSAMFYPQALTMLRSCEKHSSAIFFPSFLQPPFCYVDYFSFINFTSPLSFLFL